MSKGSLIEEALSHSVIGAFYEAYNTLGFGFLEQVYALALEEELLERCHRVEREVPARIIYKGKPLATQRLDMLVDGRLVIEIKSTELLHNGASRQVYNYLRASNLELGLLLHFGPRPVFKRVFCRQPRSYGKHPDHFEHE